MPRTGNPNWKPGCSPTNPQGRPRGTPNRRIAEAKEIISHAATIVGGAEKLAAWALESPRNEEIFWRAIVTKLLPRVTDASADAGLRMQVVDHFLVSPLQGLDETEH